MATSIPSPTININHTKSVATAEIVSSKTVRRGRYRKYQKLSKRQNSVPLKYSSSNGSIRNRLNSYIVLAGFGLFSAGAVYLYSEGINTYNRDKHQLFSQMDSPKRETR
jgi:hypothetical protein